MANQIDGASTLQPPTSVIPKAMFSIYFTGPYSKEMQPTSRNVQKGAWSKDRNHVVGIIRMDLSHSYIVSTMEPLV
ncbi:hypothetical protein C4D60_Mb10t08970 [Musa balbisiana]|uniref:Uncharacterized protein n=1 Tax=Musa balbisiana TaxID=52838 RepID=A0A4S8IWK0_MUSBA|nr:hypothetical protein C4D60_Mb10t08970 [Musa balbisiana]